MRASEEIFKERERRGRMSARSRIVLAVAALLLLSVYVLPIWKIDLEAPQYPEGLGMYIEVDNIRGVQEGNLQSINGLNHYIGMKEIHPESIPELEIMPWLVAALIVFGLGAAAFGRRWGLYTWTGLFLVLAIVGMVDFYLWEYDYGHNLDPERAIIKVPGMTYQPPLIGSKKMLNITAVSLPAAGGILAFISLFTGIGLSMLEFRAKRALKKASSAVAAGLVLVMAGCSSGPRPIAYGEDICIHCKMTITDARFGTEAVTEHGKVLTFDSIECLSAHVANAESEFASLWVTDMTSPGELIPAQEAFYVQAEAVQSPMGKNLGAFTTADARDRYLRDEEGRALRWDEVLVLGEAGHEHGVHRVRPDGPVTSLTDAVRIAAPGDRIVLARGTYHESNITVDKALTITGERGAVIESRDGEQIITILANGVHIEGLTFRGVSTSFVDDRSAIRVEEAGNCRITGNTFDDTFFGVYLAKANDCLINGNTFTASKEGQTKSGNGIHLWYSADVEIRSNRIAGHRDGIYLEFSSRIAVENNEATKNLRYGLHFMFSDNCRYLDNDFVDNDAGVAVMYSKNFEMVGNRFVDNWGSSAFGLLLKDITDSYVADNVFRKNTVGIYAEGANRIEVLRNDFIENGRALKIMANSLDSIFRHNDFVANTFDVTTNSRQSFSTFEQNYWDEYRGYDLDRDGTGDVPFYPVRLFSLIVEQHEAAVILMRSLFVDLLDAAERVLPTLTPKAVVDAQPLVAPYPNSEREASPAPRGPADAAAATDHPADTNG